MIGQPRNFTPSPLECPSCFERKRIESDLVCDACWEKVPEPMQSEVRAARKVVEKTDSADANARHRRAMWAILSHLRPGAAP